MCIGGFFLVLSFFSLGVNHYYNLIDRAIQVIGGYLSIPMGSKYFIALSPVVFFISFWIVLIGFYLVYLHEKTVGKVIKWIFNGR